MDGIIPLLCDNCGKDFGVVFENDLNGSRFYCCEDCSVAGEEAAKEFRVYRERMRAFYARQP